MAKATQKKNAVDLFEGMETIKQPEVREEVEEKTVPVSEADRAIEQGVMELVRKNSTPKKTEKRLLSGYIPVDLLEEFRSTAKANNVSISSILEQFARIYVNSYKS